MKFTFLLDLDTQIVFLLDLDTQIVFLLDLDTQIVFLLDLDTQIVFKLRAMERITQEVETLRGKRKQCDEEANDLKKKLVSCSNAMGVSTFS